MKSNYKYYQKTFHPRIIKKTSKGLTISLNNGIYFNPSFKAFESIYSPKNKHTTGIKKFDAKQLTKEFFDKLEAELFLKNIAIPTNPQDTTEDVVLDLNKDPLNSDDENLDSYSAPSDSDDGEVVYDLNEDPYSEAELLGSDSIIDLNSDSEN
jgi:hypothetical protein